MEIWSKCDICGRDIPVGELCYGLKNGNCICKDCCTGFENCTFTIAPAPTLTSPNEWVSVEDRMPDKPGHYLVCTSVNYWHGGCMDKNGVSSNKGTTYGYVGTTLSVLDCFYDTTGNWNRVCNKHVTHWMNIPAPPGAVAKNETTESNEPLTPEELRKMPGEPVWTVGVSYTNDGKWAMWDIVEKADDEGVDFGYSTEGREWWNYNLRDKAGELLGCAWVCYRRPPEGEA